MTTSASKTLAVALRELQKGLEKSEKVTITDLSKQLADNLPFNYQTFLPYGKTLKVSIETQKTNKLYSATYMLIDAKKQIGVS